MLSQAMNVAITFSKENYPKDSPFDSKRLHNLVSKSLDFIERGSKKVSKFENFRYLYNIQPAWQNWVNLLRYSKQSASPDMPFFISGWRTNELGNENTATELPSYMLLQCKILQKQRKIQTKLLRDVFFQRSTL